MGELQEREDLLLPLLYPSFCHCHCLCPPSLSFFSFLPFININMSAVASSYLVYLILSYIMIYHLPYHILHYRIISYIIISSLIFHFTMIPNIAECDKSSIFSTFLSLLLQLHLLFLTVSHICLSPHSIYLLPYVDVDIDIL